MLSIYSSRDMLLCWDLAFYCLSVTFKCLICKNMWSAYFNVSLSLFEFLLIKEEKIGWFTICLGQSRWIWNYLWIFFCCFWVYQVSKGIFGPYSLYFWLFSWNKVECKKSSSLAAFCLRCELIASSLGEWMQTGVRYIFRVGAK